MTLREEFSRGWPVLSAASIGVGLGLSPLPFYTIGVMLPEILKEFGPMGWTAGDVLTALLVYTIGAFLMSPLIGMLAERFGARRVALISIVTFSVSMMALSLNTGSRTLYAILWAFVAIGGAGTLPITFTRPVANWFQEHRGKALGIALIATGLFGTLAKFFSQHIIEISSWRMAYVAIGLLPLVISLPVSFLTLRDVTDVSSRDAKATSLKIPVLAVSLVGLVALVGIVLAEIFPLIQQQGLRLQYLQAFIFIPIVVLPLLALIIFPIAREPDQAMLAARGKGKSLPGMTLGQALQSWKFWLLAVCFVPISYAVGAVIPNIERIVTTTVFMIEPGEQVSQTVRSAAVGLAALTGLAVLAGRLIGGFLIDKFWAPGVAFLFLASPAIALWMLGQPGISQNTATLAILMIGFGAGVEYDFMAYMVSKYFGMKRYSAIYGALYGFFAIGAGFGPKIMTDMADAGGWSHTLTVAAVVLFVSTVPLLFLGRYAVFSDEAPDLDDALTEAEETVETAHA